MSRNYHSIAFTEPVLEAQGQYGSRTAVTRTDRRRSGPRGPGAAPAPGTGAAAHAGAAETDGLDRIKDPLSDAERDFIAGRDGFYLATVAAGGWPYVQFRGGPPGFVTAPDEHTLAWADFRGNRQYISTGNVAHDPRVSLIFMDYARQVRLKVFGVATISDVRDQGPKPSAYAVPGYRAIVEREVRVQVKAFDWNCPQHITPRYTAEEVGSVLQPLRQRVDDLEAANSRLRAQVTALLPDSKTRRSQLQQPQEHQ
ncbi:pyridoxamine 5'-phosphate oxidase family protein [Streptomyces tauricus]|uniref:pyridoxamine 5'-phosphate oxidase family protein n=1 Tax=Streptomyces tauricus TaxID=68274 RepID=UPI002242E3F0|nr:pyridoxamine 5'-phosphate oxidase family protein [Streptomyces tauricus]MCW8103375.1 pyridoxamine 5'-phosphate oxidase family protein [Streptomyces tauricus]